MRLGYRLPPWGGQDVGGRLADVLNLIILKQPDPYSRFRFCCPKRLIHDTTAPNRLSLSLSYSLRNMNQVVS